MDSYSIFGKKQKNKSLSSADKLKIVGFVTSTALALTEAAKSWVHQQSYDLLGRKTRQQRQQEQGLMLVAGFIGGIVAGAITALLVAPESGGELRQRITGMFGNGHDEDTAIEEASQKAEELAEAAKIKAENAERNISDN
ncbi:MAG: YtxH domain-containing protein [Cyclobacteriaceae bacterium]